MTFSVGIIDSGKAYLPEKYAYRDYLQSNGMYVEAGDQNEILSMLRVQRFDVLIRFGGVLPPIQEYSDVAEIHEFHSASTGSFPTIKNLIKRVKSKRPAGRIFLNAFVEREFNFHDGVPHILRDMGASPRLLECRNCKLKKYDIVYAGSLSGRPGLWGVIDKLVKKGYRIGLAGKLDHRRSRWVGDRPEISWVGRLDHRDVPEFLKLGKMGLNFIPDKYPYPYQTSTKVIEYLVAGLPIVSNRYPWIETHSRQHGYRYIDLVNLLNGEYCSEEDDLIVDNAASFTWPEVLRQSNFCDFVLKVGAIS
ncbi:hypothetical protein S4A8_16262 [Salinisphaera sp. S4-8]|uniref:hypothetical protein n=1 Tax=Salinisphaera sp. S4-8 TaxID=633357 RepID=UPI0033417729